jgi:hypothetical protein
MAQVQNDSGFFLVEANAALKDGIDIAVGPCSVHVPAQAVADARAGRNALRAQAGEDAGQRIYEAMAATLPSGLRPPRAASKWTAARTRGPWTAWSMTSCGGTSSVIRSRHADDARP